MGVGADKEYKLRITGDARELGQATKRAASYFNDLKREANGLAAALSGGLIGGGIGGAITSVVGQIAGHIRDARNLIREAEQADITVSSVAFEHGQERILDTPKGTISTARETARQQRANAIDGPLGNESARAFESIGLSLKKIKDLNPDDLFLEIVQAFPRNPNNLQRDSFRRLLGEQSGSVLEGFAAGGFFRSNRANTAVRLGEALAGMTKNNLNFHDMNLATVEDSPFARSIREDFKENFEPLSQYARGQENVERKKELEIRERVVRLSLEQLNVEERIAAVTEERNRLLAEASKNPNYANALDLRLRAADYDSQLIQLRALAGKPDSFDPIESSVTRMQPDQFARVGRFFFGSGSGDTISKEQLNTLRRVESLLKKLPQETGEELSARI